MPIYEYECPTCGRFEVIQSASEKPIATCEKCAQSGRKSKVQRLVSPAAFHLKGGGWYKTDYAGGGTGRNGAGKNGTSDAAESGSASSSESASEKSSKDSAATSTAKPAKGSGGGGCGGGCACH